MRYLIPLGLIIVLSSCGTTTNYYPETVKSWKGSKLSSLRKQWGRPDKTVRGPKGQLAYVYKKEVHSATNMQDSPVADIKFTANGYPIIVTHRTVNSNGNRGMTVGCTAFFVANSKGRITDARFKGNQCYGSAGFAHRLANPKKLPAIEQTAKKQG